jgi:hypothetical protein
LYCLLRKSINQYYLKPSRLQYTVVSPSVRNWPIPLNPLLQNLRVIHGWNHPIDPPRVARVVVDVKLPIQAFLSQNRPHDRIHSINEHQTLLLRMRLSSGMINVEEYRAVVGFATAVEAAGGVLVEENVNSKGGDSQFRV